MPIIIQPATITQKSEVIPLIEEASGGKLRFLINNIMPFINVKMIVSMLYAREDNVFSYLHAKTAMLDNREIVGVILTYPSSEHGVNDIMREHIPKDRLDHLTPYFESRVENSLYIGSIAIKQAHRRSGIATQFIEQALQRGKSEGYSTISTHCWADNLAALNLYEKLGFERKDIIPIPSTPRLVHEGGMVLLIHECL